MERPFDISLGEIYHIYNRGVDKRKVYYIPKDKDRFLKLLHLCNNTEKIVFRDFENKNIALIKVDERLVHIGAYCLMDNHFHLLVKEITEGGVSRFMKKLSTAYAMYFNKRNKRSGTLFENRFQAKHCACDVYLKYLFAYIHLNPIKFINPEWKERGLKDHKATKDFLKTYKYSSFHEYFLPTEPRKESIIIDKTSFPEYFMDTNFESYIDHWMKHKEVCSELLQRQ